MDVITLTAVKENIFDFTLDIQGLDNLEGLRVQLILHCDGIHYGFDCCREAPTNKFTVTVPALPHIERTAYQYSIEVVADGYHFIPITGTANFTQDPFVTGSKPTARVEITPPSIVPVREKKNIPAQEKSIRQIAEELTKAHISESKGNHAEPASELTEADKKIKATLKNVRSPTPKPTKRPVAKKKVKAPAENVVETFVDDEKDFKVRSILTDINNHDVPHKKAPLVKKDVVEY